MNMNPSLWSMFTMDLSIILTILYKDVPALASEH